MLGKRVRPWIVGLSEIDELVKCIDVFNQYTRNGQLSKNQDSNHSFQIKLEEVDQEAKQADEELGGQFLSVRSIEPFSSKKLLQDMQERLLLMSHYRLQQTLDTAPSMTQNSISKLLLATDESNSAGAKVYTNDMVNEEDQEAALELADEEIKILEETIPY